MKAIFADANHVNHSEEWIEFVKVFERNDGGRKKKNLLNERHKSPSPFDMKQTKKMGHNVGFKTHMNTSELGKKVIESA